MGNPNGMRDEAIAVVSLTVLASVLPFATSVGILLAGGIAAILLTTVALVRKMPAASSLGLLLVAVLVLGLVGLSPQQILFAAALIVYGVVASRLSWLREVLGWRRAGSCDLRQVAAGVALGLLSGVALWVWYEERPDELADLVDMVPDWSVWTLVAAGVLFAILNALLEEAVYRGVLQDALDRVLRTGVAILTLQAAAFATLHFLTGIPRGFAGIGLAFVYGLLLGLLRRRSGGMAVPVIAHTITDLAIVGIVLGRVAA